MRVSWVTFGQATRSADGSMTSNVASLRYRVLAPIKELSGQGYRHTIAPLTSDKSEAELAALLDADIIVFSKSFLTSNEHLARKAKAAGAAVIFDVCDNHYRHPKHGAHYQAMSALADQVTCNSEQMATVASAHCTRDPFVIEDPYEGHWGAPKFAPGDRLNLLWFGHPTNLDSLQASFADLVALSAHHPLSVTLLTQLNDDLVASCRQIGSRYGAALQVAARPWSLEEQRRALKACDVVIIPSLQDVRKWVKSANRMVESLWAGRPVVAQPMPAYAPFEAWMPVRPSLREGLQELLLAGDEVSFRIAGAQTYISQRFAPDVIGRRWAQILEAVKDAR